MTWLSRPQRTMASISMALQMGNGWERGALHLGCKHLLMKLSDATFLAAHSTDTAAVQLGGAWVLNCRDRTAREEMRRGVWMLMVGARGLPETEELSSVTCHCTVSDEF